MKRMTIYLNPGQAENLCLLHNVWAGTPDESGLYTCWAVPGGHGFRVTEEGLG